MARLSIRNEGSVSILRRMRTETQTNKKNKNGNGDGSIVSRPNGRYQLQVTVEGRRLSETFLTRTAAKRRLSELTTERERGLLNPPD